MTSFLVPANVNDDVKTRRFMHGTVGCALAAQRILATEVARRARNLQQTLSFHAVRSRVDESQPLMLSDTFEPSL